MDITSLDQADASLIQHGLKALGFYEGTTKGLPAGKTISAYNEYRANWGAEAKSLIPLIVKIARSQVGVKEEGNNGGPEVRKYQKATWLELGPWAWCAAFVCWVIREALLESPQSWKRPRTAGAYDFLNWAKGEGLQVIEKPKQVKAGDIVVYTFSHIGIAVEDSSSTGTVFTVEGNTDEAGSREGQGVYEKQRKLSQIRAVIRL